MNFHCEQRHESRRLPWATMPAGAIAGLIQPVTGIVGFGPQKYTIDVRKVYSLFASKAYSRHWIIHWEKSYARASELMNVINNSAVKVASTNCWPGQDLLLLKTFDLYSIHIPLQSRKSWETESELLKGSVFTGCLSHQPRLSDFSWKDQFANKRSQ